MLAIHTQPAALDVYTDGLSAFWIAVFVEQQNESKTHDLNYPLLAF